MTSSSPAGPPLISVVIPAYNAGRYITQSLGSVAGQEGDFRLELIVVDDGSSDDTQEKALAFPSVRLIAQENAGPSAARNRGIAAAQGELIAFLDADDLWTEGKLAAQMAVFQARPELGLVFGDCQRFDDSGPIAEPFFQEAGLDEAFWGDPIEVIDPYAKLFWVNYVPTGAVLLRKTALEVAGTFDESMRYVEDLDLWFRVALHCRVGYTPFLCQLKRQHSENVSNDTRVMSVAYADVIDKQRRLFGDVIKQRRVPMSRVAYRYCITGDQYERAGQKGEARRWYLKALRTSPSLRAAYYLLRTFWTTAGSRAA
jgi:glycosyltransferase involved in cell wall biosynthesis